MPAGGASAAQLLTRLVVPRSQEALKAKNKKPAGGRKPTRAAAVKAKAAGKAKAVPAKAVAAKASGGAKGTAVRATAVAAAAPAPAPAVAAAPAPKPSSSDDAMALLDSMGAVSLVCLVCH